MRGKLLFWLLAPLLALALVLQTDRCRDRLRASRILRQVELLTLGLAGAGQRAPQLLRHSLQLLEQARELDPVEVGIPIARGSLFLLLERPEAALRAYREALALEPRPEVYLNLGRAHRLAGDREAARANFRRARLLSPGLRHFVPPDLAGPPRRGEGGAGP